MKEIIRNILDKAYEEKDLDLANIANDLMGELESIIKQYIYGGKCNVKTR